MAFFDQSELTRRHFLATLGSGAALVAMPGCAARMAGPATASGPTATLDSIAWRLLEHEPERATGLGVDTGERFYLRSRLEDLSPEGQRALAETLREDLALVRATDTSGMARPRAHPSKSWRAPIVWRWAASNCPTGMSPWEAGATRPMS